MMRKMILAVFFIVASCGNCGSCAGQQSCEDCINSCQHDYGVSREACIAGYCNSACSSQP